MAPILCKLSSHLVVQGRQALSAASLPQGDRSIGALLPSTNDFQGHPGHHLRAGKLEACVNSKEMEWQKHVCKAIQSQTWRWNMSLPLTFYQLEHRHLDLGACKRLGCVIWPSAQKEKDLEFTQHLAIPAKDHVL